MIIHRAVCDECKNQEEAFTNVKDTPCPIWRPPSHWIILTVFGGTFHFCKSLCMKEYINGLQSYLP